MLEALSKSSAFWREKLAVDFLNNSRLHGVMDEDTRDLVIQLATRAGMLMEDCSVTALTLRDRSDGGLIETLQELEASASKMETLLKAGRELCE